MPIVSIVRESPVLKGGKVQQRVISLDPRAATNDAKNADGTNGVNGFVEAASYRGAFAEDSVWLCNWTATDEFGFLATPSELCAVAAPCYADLDGDGLVGGSDLGVLLTQWGGVGSADLDGNGVVNGGDFGLLLVAF